MFSRSVSIRLKPNSVAEFTKLIENEVFRSGRGGHRTGSKWDPLNHAAASNSTAKSRRAWAGVR